MLKPIVVDEHLRFGPSNTEGFLLVESEVWGGKHFTERVWQQIGLVHFESVKELRDFLTQWIDSSRDPDEDQYDPTDVIEREAE